ncbi:MAG: Spy/CpxP family protein refolding chaperone [Candidatus Thiodiazotropha sp. 6PLUC2]
MHDFPQMMKHASPMPNYMKVVKQHEAALDLSEEQSKELAAWRESHGKPMHAKVAQITELEKSIYDATMAGKSKAEILDLASKMLELRSTIISTKIDCRDNMKRVLSEEQFAKVVKLYSGS